jgi:rhamnose utilization protein RhaD (predicted bifunctional aldolase and dehydrogenase)
VDQLVKLSRFYGSDPEMVIAGGGNTSVKVGDKMWVKGSGFALATIPPEGFVEMDRPKLQKLLEGELPVDRNAREEQFKKHVMGARLAPELGQRPSVEAVLHHLMPGKFVVHSHSTLVNMFTCHTKGEQTIKETLGDAVIWVANVDPGFVLAQTIDKSLHEYKAKTGRNCPRALIMQNHGLVICGDTPEQVKADTDWLLATLRKRLEQAPAGDPFGALAPRDTAEVRKQINIIAPALRAILATGEDLKVATFDDSEIALALVDGAEGKTTTDAGPLSPDQIVYCKSFPMWFDAKPGEEARETVKRLQATFDKHLATTKLPPHVVLVKGVGMFCVGDKSRHEEARTPTLDHLGVARHCDLADRS